MTDFLRLHELQVQREVDSATAGYDRFIRNQQDQSSLNRGSNSAFGVYVKGDLIPKVIENMNAKLEDINRIRESEIKRIMRLCIGAAKTKGGDIKTHDYWDLELVAFLGLQLTLDTAMNPNYTQQRQGGEKKLLAKKTETELKYQIGSVIHEQLSLKVIQTNFPEWFRRADKLAQKKNKEGCKASTSYWSYRMKRSIEELKVELDKDGDDVGLSILNQSSFWSYRECVTIGSWVYSAVFEETGLFTTVRKSKDGSAKMVEYVVLTDAAKEKREELHTICKEFQHDTLPMLVPPQPVTNDCLGGWLNPSLQRKGNEAKGSIELSAKHLEFINRQARTAFEINPFTLALFQELIAHNLSLGKFFYYESISIPSVSSLLGYANVSDYDEQTRLVKADPKVKEARKHVSDLKDLDRARSKRAIYTLKLVEKAKRLAQDERFYIPMEYDFRGRVYSRVPYVSFQSADPGRYLIRFHEKTPIDDRTEHWLKIGISNAGGNDKLCWDKRIQWFDRYRSEIINVGRMVDGGDFTRAHAFLAQDHIDDPFALASLANEYVRVFVDKSQDYTQCYVCVDASCSGSAIFNAWRRNKRGGEMVNLTNSSSPQDIYMEVWREIKRLTGEHYRSAVVRELERTKLIRKMMKQTFVPAQYAQPANRQRYNLTVFNSSKLRKAGLEFTEDEMKVLMDAWAVALDEVSSIQTVVDWFKDRTNEALDNGAQQITYTSCNGSVMTLQYPRTKETRVQSFHRGQAKFQRLREMTPTDEPNAHKLLAAVTANVTHLTDASALCAALWDFEAPWIGIHDACGLPPGKLVDEGVSRLKEGLIEATSYSVWDQFRLDNGLPLDPATAGPVIGDLDLNDIRESNYIFS